jgi:hypothetical protein
MLRITERRRHEDGRTVLAVEGRLAGPWVDELRRAAAPDAAGAGSTALDLTGLAFADERGAALLRELADAGVEVVGASAYVAVLLGRRE